jgi:hypothetical protein
MCSHKKLIKLERLGRILACRDAAAIPISRLTEDAITYSYLVQQNVTLIVNMPTEK